MIDIAVSELHKHYGANHIIRGVSFEINSGERVGLLGKNGSGKTTLFRIISGEEGYESGSLAKASGKKIEVLAQIPVFDEEDTVEDILRSSFKEILEIAKAMKKIEGDASDAALQKYGRLMEEYERLGGYEMEVRVEKICNGMKIDETLRQSPFATLSGGEKTRVNLARILLRDCDILLLDEPTNHLDLASLTWLEGFLRDYPGTVAVISHDRIFLDNTVTRIIEIENGKANFYSGNYSWYAEEKRRRFISQSEQYERQQKEIKRIEDRAKWFVENNRFTTKHHAILSRIDHMEKIEKPHTSSQLAKIRREGSHLAIRPVELMDVSKAFDDKVLLKNVNIFAQRFDSIALVGPNGCGKTTLLKMIMGEAAADDGVVHVSSNVKAAYMPQIVEFEDEEATVLETLRKASGLLEGPARSVLAGLKFRGEDVTKKVGRLSGGEKSRLKLCLLMQDKVNFLMLDEPTNHLDIQSREWFEEALIEWGCTMLFISHDRMFLNKFSTRVWAMENGEIRDFHGSFEEYNESLAETKPSRAVLAEKKKKPRPKAREQAPKQIKIEDLICETEAELAHIAQAIEVELAARNYQKMDELYREKEQLEAQLEILYADFN